MSETCVDTSENTPPIIEERFNFHTREFENITAIQSIRSRAGYPIDSDKDMWDCMAKLPSDIAGKWCFDVYDNGAGQWVTDLLEAFKPYITTGNDLYVWREQILDSFNMPLQIKIQNKSHEIKGMLSSIRQDKIEILQKVLKKVKKQAEIVRKAKVRNAKRRNSRR